MGDCFAYERLGEAHQPRCESGSRVALVQLSPDSALIVVDPPLIQGVPGVSVVPSRTRAGGPSDEAHDPVGALVLKGSELEPGELESQGCGEAVALGLEVTWPQLDVPASVLCR
jgi:hypothetical protein